MSNLYQVKGANTESLNSLRTFPDLTSYFSHVALKSNPFWYLELILNSVAKHLKIMGKLLKKL